MPRGFTLIELLVVTSIILLLTAIILPNYRLHARQLVLERSSHKLAQDLRRTQEMVLSGKEFSGAMETFEGGYGLELKTGFPFYIIFADLDNDRILDSGEDLESIVLEPGAQISQLLPGSPLNIVFYPPDPAVFFSPAGETASIEIEVTGLGGRRTVKINKAGLIFIE